MLRKSAWRIAPAIAIASTLVTGAYADDKPAGASPETAEGAEKTADGAEDTKPAIDQARDLARAAFDFLDAQKYAEALDHIERAEKLYHAPIHLKVMGQALEGLNRRAEAAAVYDRLVAEPLPSSSAKIFLKAQDFAKSRLKELASRLPLLLLKVRGAAAEQVTATLDGRPITVTGTAVRLDPGDHQVKVTAQGHIDFERKVTLKEGAGVVVVEAAMRRPGEPLPDPNATPQPVVVKEETPVLPWVAFGIGGAGLIAGAVTGALSLSQAAELDERCPERRCLPSDQGDHDTAVALGWTSTVTLGLGVAGVAAGVVLLVVDLGEDEGEAEAGQPKAQLRIGPGSLSLRARF